MKQLDPLVNLWPKGNTMRGSMQDNAALAADAYLAWWQLAGVECAVTETAISWLAAPVPAAVPSGREATIAAPTGAPAQPRPADLATFHKWLETDTGHPERRWPAKPVYPVGPEAAPVMVVTDMPDAADADAGALLADRPGLLFEAMLRAIGLTRDKIYLTSLFFARPPGGMMDAADMVAVAERMRSHVHLARPRRLLLLGDRTIRALASANGADNDHALRDFKHDGGTVSTVATFHPRLLLGQPGAKMECWRALQMLIEEAHT